MKKLLFLLIFATTAMQAQNKIENVRINRHISFNGIMPEGYIEVTARFTLPIPNALLVSPYLAELAESYKGMYQIDSVAGTNLIFQAKVSTGIYVENNPALGITSEEDVMYLLEAEYGVHQYKLSLFQLFPFDAIIGKRWNGTTWVY